MSLSNPSNRLKIMKNIFPSKYLNFSDDSSCFFHTSCEGLSPLHIFAELNITQVKVILRRLSCFIFLHSLQSY